MPFIKQRYVSSLIAGGAAFSFVFLFIAAAVFSLLSQKAEQGGETIFSPYVFHILRFTLFQAVLSTLLSVFLAVPVAMALARQPSFWGRIWIIRLFAVPMGLPVIVGALGIITVWGQQGVLNKALSTLGLSEPISIYGLNGILLAHVFFNLPLAVRLLLVALERIPVEYWRSTASLGMSQFSVFRFVEWPAMRSGMVSAASLIFMLCLTSFTVVLILGGGPAATTIEVAIYQALRFDFDPQRAVTLALLQILLAVALLFVTSLVPKAEDDVRTAGTVIRRFDGLSKTARLRDFALILAAAVFVASPLLAVVVSGLAANLFKLLVAEVFIKAFLTSFSIALCAASMAVVVSLSLSHARLVISGQRQATVTERATSAVFTATSSLVLLVPPVVIGSGWFIWINRFTDPAGYAPIMVTFINMLVSLPFVTRVLEPALEIYRDRTDRLSQSLGLSGFSKFRLVTWPLMRKAVFMAMSFSLALSLGDLGAVALFGSDGFVTLPWLVYSNMGSYRSADAAGYALILGVICLLLAVYGAGFDKRPDEKGNA